MNEQNNQSDNLQDNHNETAQPLISDLEAHNAEEIIGGPSTIVVKRSGVGLESPH